MAWTASAFVVLSAAILGSAIGVTYKSFEALLLFGRAYWLGDPLAIPVHQLQNGALLVFAFFMISDPKTTPDTGFGRVLIGALLLGALTSVAEIGTSITAALQHHAALAREVEQVGHGALDALDPVVDQHEVALSHGGVARVHAAARESHVARPGVTLPTGPLDKEQLLATVFCGSKDKGDGRSGESAPKRYLVGAQMA